MKISIDWLKELVEIDNLDMLLELLPLRTIATKEVTDAFIELDMKGYNRADLLSMRGVAYEVAALLGTRKRFEEEEFGLDQIKSDDIGELEVEVKNSDLCFVYCLARIEGLKVGKSNPDWIKKLEDSGMRSVNNIADITNLVMLEYGQPLHAFDADKVNGRIVVRRAKNGEELKTLDGKIKVLEDTDLVIADGKKGLGIAGVMGGENSEITENTTTILLEAAVFDPVTLRRTAKRLNLSSEASKRFYHGLTKKRLIQALQKAIKMYEGLGGRLVGVGFNGDLKDEERTLVLSFDKAYRLIGVSDLTRELVETYLRSLYFDLEPDEHGWRVKVPFFRRDIEHQEDLIEEVARLYGYERIAARELEGEIPPRIDQNFFDFIEKLKHQLVRMGLAELQTYSFYSTRSLKALGFKDKNVKYLVKIVNPISSETEYMRQNIWPNLVEKVVENSKFYDDIAVFEIGKVFEPQMNERPIEKYQLSIAISNSSTKSVLEIYRLLELVLEELKVEIGFEKKRPEGEGENYFHPGKYFAAMKDGKTIGRLAEIKPEIAFRYGTEKRVSILEIDLESVLTKEIR